MIQSRTDSDAILTIFSSVMTDLVSDGALRIQVTQFKSHKGAKHNFKVGQILMLS